MAENTRIVTKPSAAPAHTRWQLLNPDPHGQLRPVEETRRRHNSVTPMLLRLKVRRDYSFEREL